MRAGFEFKLLGPLEVSREGATLSLGGERQRALLALLLTRANQLVTTADKPRLCDDRVDARAGEQSIVADVDPVVSGECAENVRVMR